MPLYTSTLLHLEGNTVLFTALQLFDSYSNKLLYKLRFLYTKYMKQLVN